MTRPVAAPLTIRLMDERDEVRVLDLLTAAMGPGPAGARTAEFFRWKHVDNPFGSSFMLVAESDGNIVGLRAFMRWRFEVAGLTVAAVRAVDTATHPAFQGRGIFSTLTKEALERIRPEAAFIFNTPNEKSLPGYLKMGWSVAGRIPVWVRIARPVRVARGAKDIRGGEPPVQRPPVPAADPAAQVLSETSQLSDLVEESRLDRRRLSTARDMKYLRWRYADAPSLDYRAIAVERGDQIRGLAIFRVRPRGPLWEATVAELLVRRGDDRSARDLLRGIRSSVRVDHVTSGFPAGSSPTRRLPIGFFPSRMGPTFVVNVLDHKMDPDPGRLSSWALTLGDVEVF